MVAEAAALAALAHAGQLDKQGYPYIYHPARVADAVRLAGGSFEAQAVAWMHDVLEDTETRASHLHRMGWSLEVIHSVKLLTHEPGAPNVPYWEALKRDPIAHLVKKCDMLDNCRPERMIPNEQQSADDIARREAKYARGLRFLQGPWSTVAEMEKS